MVTILLIEDNPTLGRMYSTFLTKNGYTALHTTTCQETRTLLAQAIPDIVILDINLPDGSGLTLAELIRATPHLEMIPIIVLSAVQPRAEEIQRYRIDHVLRKPASLPMLQELLEHMVTPSKRAKVSAPTSLKFFI